MWLWLVFTRLLLIFLRSLHLALTFDILATFCNSIRHGIKGHAGIHHNTAMAYYQCFTAKQYQPEQKLHSIIQTNIYHNMLYTKTVHILLLCNNNKIGHITYTSIKHYQANWNLYSMLKVSIFQKIILGKLSRPSRKYNMLMPSWKLSCRCTHNKRKQSIFATLTFQGWRTSKTYQKNKGQCHPTVKSKGNVTRQLYNKN